MTDLTQAIEELRRVTPPNSPWEVGDIGVGSSPVDYHIATILNAVISGDLIPKSEIEKALSDPTSVHYSMLKGTIAKPTLAQIIHLYGGDLIPRADADLAVALMVEKAADRMDCVRFDPPDHWDAQVQNEHYEIIKAECLTWQRNIRALVPASALAELQALRDDVTGWISNAQVAREKWSEYEARAEAAEADITTYLRIVADMTQEAETDKAELVTLLAQVERLTGALRPFCFFGDNNDDPQDAWEMRYLDRFEDWIDYEDIDSARAALTEGAAP